MNSDIIQHKGDAKVTKGVFVYCVGDFCSHGGVQHSRDYGRDQRGTLIEKDQSEISRSSEVTDYLSRQYNTLPFSANAAFPARGAVHTMGSSTRKRQTEKDERNLGQTHVSPL